MHFSDTIGGVLRRRWVWVRFEFKKGGSRDGLLSMAVKFGDGDGKVFSVHFLLLHNCKKMKIVVLRYLNVQFFYIIHPPYVGWHFFVTLGTAPKFLLRILLHTSLFRTPIGDD